MVVCDSNILIDFVRQKGRGLTFLEKITEKEGRKNLAISILTVQELFAGKSVSELAVKQNLTQLISSFDVYPYTYEVAQLGGEIARNNPVAFVDGAIAATAIVNGAELATLNLKDFEGIKELELYEF